MFGFLSSYIIVNRQHKMLASSRTQLQIFSLTWRTLYPLQNDGFICAHPFGLSPQRKVIIIIPLIAATLRLVYPCRIDIIKCFSRLFDDYYMIIKQYTVAIIYVFPEHISYIILFSHCFTRIGFHNFNSKLLFCFSKLFQHSHAILKLHQCPSVCVFYSGGLLPQSSK